MARWKKHGLADPASIERLVSTLGLCFSSAARWLCEAAETISPRHLPNCRGAFASFGKRYLAWPVPNVDWHLRWLCEVGRGRV
jgi:hypothetical protein